METDPVLKHCFLVLEFWMMGKVQNLKYSECYTPSSEPLRFYHRTLAFFKGVTIFFTAVLLVTSIATACAHFNSKL
jgi:cytochrome c biogenesis protein CcdA